MEDLTREEEKEGPGWSHDIRRRAVNSAWTPRKCGLRFREKGRVGRGKRSGRRPREVRGPDGFLLCWETVLINSQNHWFIVGVGRDPPRDRRPLTFHPVWASPLAPPPGA